MSRSLRDLTFKQQRRSKEGLLFQLKNYAFDTENRPGKPAEVLCSNIEPRLISSLDDCLAFLTRSRYRASLNVFWNMDYDIASIMKYEPDLMKELYTEQETEYKTFELSYIDEKKFTIRHNKRKWSYYDLQQYYKEQTPSLAGAARKYLNKEPDELKGDRDKLFDLYPLARIAKYCMNDCQLTKELCDYTTKGLSDIGFIAL